MLDLAINNARIVDGTGAPTFTASVGVKDGVITQVSEHQLRAKRQLEGDGQMLTPGFVDIHTHYDGQVCWDKQITPSCWHGVTTVVMGNCGVGFAPVREGDENRLVELMESVEDIPGSALNEGITWGWESYAQYLDAIDTPYVMDVGSQVPHVPIRRYVMGDRCYDDATDQDIAQMAEITRDAIIAGGLGFSTSRFYGHLDKQGRHIPGTHAAAKEMLGLGRAFEGIGRGTIEIISDYLEDDDELAWIKQIMQETGRTVTTLSSPRAKKIWQVSEDWQREGLDLRPQIGARPASILMSLDGTINPLAIYPSYKAIRGLPLDEQIALLRDPSFREKLKSDTPKNHRHPDAVRFTTSFGEMYPLDERLSYEPGPEDSIQGIADKSGQHHLDVLMDAMADRTPVIFFFGGYPGSLQAQFDKISHPRSLFGLSDGGAHCGVLCDASVPTYMMSYATRDRLAGDRLSVEFVVHKLTQNSATAYGLTDRGVIAPGYQADFNLIDYEKLSLQSPEMVYDLPGNGKRLIQKAQGYAATISHGQVTFEQGEATDALPGGLLRGGQI